MSTFIVGMADMKVCKHPDTLTTLGLGSCIGLTLYDSRTKISGLAHVMLPESTRVKNNQNIAKFADTAIEELLNKMIRLGAKKSFIVAKMAGGAQMFKSNKLSEIMRIGEKNKEAVKEQLIRLNIKLIAEDCGKNYGRTIELHSENGELYVKSIGKDLKVI